MSPNLYEMSEKISYRDSLYEVSNAIFLEKNKNKYFKMSSADIFIQHAKLKHRSDYLTWSFHLKLAWDLAKCDIDVTYWTKSKLTVFLRQPYLEI